VLWIFFACNILGAISTWFLIPETKGRDADVVDFQEWQEAGVEKVVPEKVVDEKVPEEKIPEDKVPKPE
jgi:hypothetical protein